MRQQCWSPIKLGTDQSAHSASAHQANLCSSQQNLAAILVVTSRMADPAVTTTSVATTTTTTAATGSSASGSGLGLDPAIVEALRAAVRAEVRAALPLAPPGSAPGPSVPPSVAASGTPLLPTASSAISGELTALGGRYKRCRVLTKQAYG